MWPWSAFDHVQQACRAGAVARGGQVDDDGDVLVAAAGVAPHVLTDPEHRDAVEAGRIGDEHASAFGEHRGVRAAPPHSEALGDPGDGEVLPDDPGERPRKPSAGDLRPRLRSRSLVLAPHPTTRPAAVAADDHLERGRPNGACARRRVTESRGVASPSQPRHQRWRRERRSWKTLTTPPTDQPADQRKPATPSIAKSRLSVRHR